MDPPPPKSVGSSHPPRPPRKNAAPPSQLSRQQPQESSQGIQESQLLSWFQEIFPGQDLPLCIQPETNNDPPRDYTLQRMQSLPRSNPVPWHKSRERLLLRELYPHLDALCTDSISKQREGLLQPRPRLQAIPFPSLDSPPRSHKNHHREYKNLNYCHGFKKYSLVKIFHYVFNRRRIMILLETTHYNACRVFLDQTLYHGISHENDYYYVNYILILMLYVLIQSRSREKDFYHRGLGFMQYHFLL
ncbi:hypothetical protein RYX36_010675 [Vicia faba]